MFSLEELTKDELIEWIRKNEPEIDEGEIVKQTLIQRIEYAFEKSTSFFERHKEVSSKASELINPYIPDGAKGGMRIYNVPADVIQRYQALDKNEKIYGQSMAHGTLSAGKQVRKLPNLRHISLNRNRNNLMEESDYGTED